MNVARFSVTRPVAVVMRIASLVLLGVVCLTKLPVDLLPKASLPTLAVITSWPNVAPEEVETQITRPIEQAVASASNIYQVSSTSTQGSSVVRIQFNYGTDIGQATINVLQQVERARQGFPQDPTLGTPLVVRFDPSQLPILIYGVSGEPDLARLKSELNNQVAPIFQSAGGVASAVAVGGLDRSIIVDVDPDKLQSFHLALADVSRRIVQENLDVPGGIAKQGDTEYTIRTLGYFKRVEDIGTIPVGSFNGQLVELDQVAAVRDSSQEQRQYTRLDGEPAVGMIIVKQSDANTVETASNVQEKLKQVNKLFPNLRWGLAYDQSIFVTASIDDVRNSALIGGALAVIILLLFLRNFRSTLVVALSIPISIISTFTLMYLCGFTLNTLSLSGLSLATGLIVDDAVVVLENIFRHIQRDRLRPPEGAIAGTNEISGAVVSSTITVMVVFLPLFLIQGLAGQMFIQFALVVIFSLAISLLDAMTVVPMLASRLINEGEIEEEASLEAEHARRAEGPVREADRRDMRGRETPVDDRDRERHRAAHRGLVARVFDWFGERFAALDAAYHRGLGVALNHRGWVLGGAIVATAAALVLVPQIGTEMLPQTDSGNFTVNLKMPVGTALADTNQIMLHAEAVVRKNPDVQTVFSAAGTTLSLSGNTTALTPYQGSMTVRLKDNRKHSTQQIMQTVQRQLAPIAGARVIVQPYDIVTQILSGGNQNVEVDVYGNDLAGLSAVTRDVLAQVRQIPGMENADTNVQDATPEFQLEVDRQKAHELGLTFSDIATTVNTATNGALSSYYQEEGFQYPIYVEVPTTDRKSFSQILSLPVSPQTGSPAGSTGNATPPSAPRASTAGVVTVTQVAKPTIALGPNEIPRQNSQRYIGITAIASGRSQSAIITDLQRVLNRYHFPPGYYWDFGRQQKQQSQEFSGLGLAVGMAVALIYMLLASQFESLLYPLAILVSVPLSAIGVILALFLTGRHFGLTAFIGLLLLIGIVVKNGILLIDYTNQLRARGMARNDAILTASPTRLRPILMTTSAAILGMLPLALALGKGSETQAPLATAVIGGLATSTMLTLFVVPIVYTLFDDLGRILEKRSKRGE
ncbi:MAG TPA: efflux RND transporter permease subunit [Chthonomonadaceae bacterium]|nr:efflux RND transporter permease subunit [Chthonomonadaceae bacterium]